MIVIIAKEDDKHAVAVRKHLETKHKERVFIFNTSTFPTTTRLSGIYGKDAFNMSLTDELYRQVDLHEVKSFWWRRPQGVVVDPTITEPMVYQFTLNECMTAIYGMLRSLGGMWVNDIANDDRADYKPFQLEMARKTGISIPETLITNDMESVLDFWRAHDEQVVFKTFNQRGIIWCPTRLLKPEDIRKLTNLRFAPVIFQSLVPGNRDIRVAAVGDRFFAVEFIIDDENVIDYRTILRPELSRVHELPPHMIEKCRKFMCALGLEYGGIDFRLTPEGDYVFFEINTEGEFMYLEELTGLPIAEAMADHLARGQRVNI